MNQFLKKNYSLNFQQVFCERLYIKDDRSTEKVLHIRAFLYFLFDLSVNFLPIPFFALFLKYIAYGQTSSRPDTNYSKLEAIVIQFVILVIFI